MIVFVVVIVREEVLGLCLQYVAVRYSTLPLCSPEHRLRYFIYSLAEVPETEKPTHDIRIFYVHVFWCSSGRAS